MKANSRRRVLISSMCMLLVAIVALGTATYAWFSTKITANVNGISVESSKASGLLISEDNASWSSVVNYSNAKEGAFRNDILEPVSSALQTLSAPIFYKGVAADPTNYAVNTDGFTKATYTTSAGLVNVYDLYAKTADESLGNLYLSVDANGITDAGEYGRIAIVRYANTDISATDTDSLKVYYMAAEGEDETDVFPVKEDTSIADAYPMEPVNNINNINLGQIKNSTHFRIFVWNEGQDNDCYTTNAGKALSCNFELRLEKVETSD